MRIIRTKDYKDMSRKAANVISAEVLLNPSTVLGLATGGTVVGTYEILVNRYNAGDLDFSKVKTINLDEYVGLSPTHDQSYRYYMDTNFFNHININKQNTFIPSGLTNDVEKECQQYDEQIEKLGGIRLQLLGLGNNGHIGFNEPGDTFEQLTHCVTLEEDTIKSNARFFESEKDVPRKAITMGIRSISQADILLLCVSGSGKAAILNKVLTGPVTPKVPGSIIQMHPNLIVVADEEALSSM